MELISSLIDRAESGDHSAAGVLFDALYSELHRLARRELGRAGAGVSLGATTLLHEAYLDMAARDGATFPDRARFMVYAARVMRGLVIDHARNRRAQKRGGQFEITSADALNTESVVDYRELTEVSEALDELSKLEPALAEIVDLKFFLRFLLRRNRRHAWPIGTDCATEMGEGAHLSPPKHPVRYVLRTEINAQT